MSATCNRYEQMPTWGNAVVLWFHPLLSCGSSSPSVFTQDDSTNVRKDELCRSKENTSVPSLWLWFNTHCLPLCLGIDWQSKRASSLCVSLSTAGDWFRRWKVITGCYTHSLNLASVSLPLLSVSVCHYGAGSFPNKTSWLCISAALTGKASQLRIRRHGARWPIGSGCRDHSCSVIQGVTPPIHTHTHTHFQSQSLVAKWCLDVESRASIRVRKHLTDHWITNNNTFHMRVGDKWSPVPQLR